MSLPAEGRTAVGGRGESELEECFHCLCILGPRYPAKALALKGRLRSACEVCYHLFLLQKLFAEYDLSAEDRAVLGSALKEAAAYAECQLKAQRPCNASEGEGEGQSQGFGESSCGKEEQLESKGSCTSSSSKRSWRSSP